MTSLPGYESIVLPPKRSLDLPESTPSQTPETYGLHTMMVTDFTVPEGHPDRYTAILVTPEQFMEMTTSKANEFGQYTLIEGQDCLYSAPVHASVVKPLHLAARSAYRGSAANEEQATSNALNSWFYQLVEVINVNESRPTRLQ